MAMENEEHRAAMTQDTDLFKELLIHHSVATDHGLRWLEAAKRGDTRHRLTRECERQGYRALPLWEYLSDVANQADVAITRVEMILGLGAQPRLGVVTVKPIAKFLRKIGCSEMQILHLVRLEFAEQHRFSVKTELALLHRANGSGDNSGTCAEVLNGVEARYSAALRKELSEVCEIVRRSKKNG